MERMDGFDLTDMRSTRKTRATVSALSSFPKWAEDPIMQGLRLVVCGVLTS